MEIVSYGHPSLRSKGRAVAEVDARVRRLAAEMLETMAEAHGVGLAAQQVGVPLQLCVLDVRGVEDRPSGMRINGEAIAPEERMPLVLLNPRIELSGAPVTENEGCLSFPGIVGRVPRPARVRVEALDLDGAGIRFEAEGLLGRAIQHEVDHLQGILFIDRMAAAERRGLQAELERLLASSPFQPAAR